MNDDRWWRPVAHSEVPADDAAEDPEPGGSDGPHGSPVQAGRPRGFMGFSWVKSMVMNGESMGNGESMVNNG